MARAGALAIVACAWQLLGWSGDAAAADYYVSPLGSDGATGALNAPFRTIARGVAAAMPGDTVHVRGGRYVGWQNQINPVRAGTQDAWITFKAYDGELPILLPPADATEASAFEPIDDPEDAFDDVPIAFIRVEGFVAYQWPTSGFSNGWEKHANNIEVRHCIADGNGVNGLTFYEASGVTFENNIAAHNGNRAPSYSSGVNLYRVQGGAGVNVVRGNVSFENIDICGNNTQHPCDPALSTDGNGFILDEGGQGVRFESNLAFRNGGSCLRMTLTPGAQLVNNTCYNNGLDTGYEFTFGEIFFSDAMSRNDILVRNNLAVGTNGQAVINNTNGTNANVGNNAFASSASVFRDPDGDNPDFRLSAGAGTLVDGGDGSATGASDLGFDPGCIVRAASPIQGVAFWQYAINYSYIESIGGVAACFRAAARSSGSAPDMGAYEAPGGACQFASDCPAATAACTRGVCNAGQCGTEAIAGCCSADTDCDDGDACTVDVCNASQSCSHLSSGNCAMPAGNVTPPSGNVNGTPVTPPGDATGAAGAPALTPDPGATDAPAPGVTGGASGDPGSAPNAVPARASSGGCTVVQPPAVRSAPWLWPLFAALALRMARRGAKRSALFAALFGAFGCGSDEAAPATNPVPEFLDPAPEDPAGSESLGGGASALPNGQSGAGGSTTITTPGAGGSTTTPSSNTQTPPVDPDAPRESGPAQVCGGAAAAEDGLIVDFGSYDFATGQWGDDASGQLTGGTSAYSCADNGACPASAALAMSATDAGAMRLEATLPPGGYSGVVWWFGPCINAASFEGLQFLAGGNLGGALMLFKVQTHQNYPVDVANSKGACEYRSELNKWSECVPPTVRIGALSAGPEVVDLSWAQFAEGLPNAGVTPDGLVGVEVQFQCQMAAPCALDLSLGTLLLKRPTPQL